MKKMLHRKPTSLNEGLVETIANYRKKYFSKNRMSANEQLTELYAREQQIVIEQGINEDIVNKMKRTYFRFINGKYEAADSYWRPTGLVFGLPLPTDMEDQLEAKTNDIFTELGLKPRQFWRPDKKLLHSTLVSYSHYFTSGTNLTSIPSSEIMKAKRIVERYHPIEIFFKGLLITNFGSILAKGFVNNTDIFLLRDELLKKISGIEQRQPSFIHIKLGQLLGDVPYERVAYINRIYRDIQLKSAIFDQVTVYNGEHIKFKTDQ